MMTGGKAITWSYSTCDSWLSSDADTLDTTSCEQRKASSGA